MKEKRKQWIDEYKALLLLAIFGTLCGIAVGFLTALFGSVLLTVSAFRSAHAALLLPWLAFAGLAIVWLSIHAAKDAAKGMSLVFAAGQQQQDMIPKRLIPYAMLTTWLTHLFGGSAGREGVAVQIGAAFSHAFHRILPFEDRVRISVITGMAAGFAGLFQTPLAAVCFSMEVLYAGKLQYRALPSSICAAFAACFTSHALGSESFTFPLSAPFPLSFPFAGKLALLGILFGICGGFFAWGLAKGKEWTAKWLPNPYIRIFFGGLILTLLLFLLHNARYCGLGTDLISASLSQETILPYDWLLKMLLTIATLSFGFQGGEVTPLFSIGASFGAIIALIFHLPIPFTAAMGYAAVFAGASNTFFAPILIGAEVFGYELLPCLFIVCTFAYLFNRGQSIYTKQGNRNDKQYFFKKTENDERS